MASTGAEIASAYVTITTKMPGVQKDIAKQLGGVDGRAIGQQLGGKISTGLTKTVKVAGAGIAAILGTAMVKGFNRLKSIENAQAKMRGLGYDAKTVQTAMSNALKSVQGTAFGLGEAASIAGGAMAAQIKPGKQLETHLTRVANNAAAAGVSFEDMGALFNKAATQANGVQNDVIGMLADKGIPIYKEIGRLMGVTGGEVFKLASQGKVSFEVFSQAAEAAAGTVAAEVGGTTTGAFDNMMAALGRLGAKILEDIFPLIGPLFKDVTGWLDAATLRVEPLVAGFSGLFTLIKDGEFTASLREAFGWEEDGKAVGFLLSFRDGLIKVGQVIGQATSGLMTFGQWVVQNKDWLGPLAVAVGAGVLAFKAYSAVTSVLTGLKIGYAAASYGAVGATYASGIASKIGAAAYAIQNSSLVKLIASLRANEALTLRSKIAIVASTVATKAAAVGQRLWNVAMKANPIGVVITAVAALAAGLTWFFTKTETGRKVWAEFTSFLSEAWANVSSFFKTVWESYLKPVFDGIGAVVQWLWKNILEPYFNGWKILFAIVGGIIAGIWESVLKPVFDAIGAVVGWLWNNIVKPYFGLVAAQFRAVGAVVSWLWTNAVQPAFAFIGQVISVVWNSVIKPVFAAIYGVIANTLGPVFTWLYQNVIQPAWNNIKAVISGVWTNGIKPVIDTLVRVIQSDPKKAFEAARDAIGVAWSGIQELAKKPVKFVIETVINGLIGTINKIPGVDIPKVPLPKGFAQGGILPGWSRMSHGDDQLIAARRGEGVMVSEALRTPADKALFTAANNAGRRGIGLAQSLAGLQGLAKGGFVHPLPGAVITEEYGGYPGHKGIDMALPAGSPIRAAASGLVNFSGWYGGGGWMAGIDHRNGFVTHYKHMMSPPPVNVGQPVTQGQVIGFEGSTGDSTGPHLHFETILNGNRLNPRNFMNFDGSDSGDGGFFNILGGLKDGLLGKLKDAFPGGGMFVDVAAGLASSAIDGSLDFVKSMLGFHNEHEPKLYDNGGWLQPGLSLVANKTGAPERILTDSQWDALADRGSGSGVFHLYDSDGVLFGTMRGIADDAVDDSLADQARARRFAGV